MGKPGKKPEMREIAETRQAGRDAAFDELIEKIKTAGAEILEDETSPLYIDIGVQQFEVGTQRTIIFHLKQSNRMDFQLIRSVETHILQGAGHQKHIEELESPRIRMTLKRKPDTSNDWQIVDIDDLF
ncbi:hypothetical protein HYW82_01985 [Candidatus Peregrinibacteria bacterium]|nr:hypothetical protein [Candidatus Peregrinibacteria bacterium]